MILLLGYKHLQSFSNISLDFTYQEYIQYNNIIDVYPLFHYNNKRYYYYFIFLLYIYILFFILI